jgi:hypothetical protein
MLARAMDAAVANARIAEAVALEVGESHVWQVTRQKRPGCHRLGTPNPFFPSAVRHLSHWPAPAAIPMALMLRGSSLLTVIVI